MSLLFYSQVWRSHKITHLGAINLCLWQSILQDIFLQESRAPKIRNLLLLGVLTMVLQMKVVTTL